MLGMDTDADDTVGDTGLDSADLRGVAGDVELADECRVGVADRGGGERQDVAVRGDLHGPFLQLPGKRERDVVQPVALAHIRRLPDGRTLPPHVRGERPRHAAHARFGHPAR